MCVGRFVSIAQSHVRSVPSLRCASAEHLCLSHSVLSGRETGVGARIMFGVDSDDGFEDEAPQRVDAAAGPATVERRLEKWDALARTAVG